eukprot:1144163-Pelagomonas_calceolata.AAC.8
MKTNKGPCCTNLVTKTAKDYVSPGIPTPASRKCLKVMCWLLRTLVGKCKLALRSACMECPPEPRSPQDLAFIFRYYLHD